MKILFLGKEDNPLVSWLREQGEEVIFTGEPINKIHYIGFDFVISYGYRHIIPKEIIDQFPRKIINLHISYLPWNRGADPNFWSWYDNTPKGVTIHHIDEGIDTGEIIVQKEVSFNHGHTLKTSYERLNEEIQKLFKEYWSRGSYHSTKEGRKLINSLKHGWDTKVNEVHV